MAASNFSSLRSARKSLLNKLAAQAKAESSKGGSTDERFWKLTTDPKTKIGYAKLRFLPAVKGEELPWARKYQHTFQGPGGNWLYENCPTSLSNRPCPICAENNRLWNTGLDSDKEIARKRKRKQVYISNVLVIEDPAKPENNGKVFLFSYGPKIHEKIMELIEPQFPDQEPTNPFDFWEGADFKLKSRDQGGFQNYDKSEFSDPAELFPGDDDAKEKLWESQKPLAEFTAESAFKSYEDLEKRLVAVLTGSKPGRAKTVEEAIKQEQALDTETLASAAEEVATETAKSDFKERARAAANKKKATAKPAKDTAKPKAKPEPEPESEPEDDDIRSFFSSLDED